MDNFSHGHLWRPIIRWVGFERSSIAVVRRILFLGMGITLLLSVVGTSVFGGLSQTGTGERLNVQRFRLLNGLQILFLRSEVSDKLVLNLLIKSGSTQDPAHKPGIADLTARHLLVEDPDQQKALEALGIELQVDVQPDATIFRMSMPPHRLRIFLGLLGAELARPMFEAEVKLATSVVRNDPLSSAPEVLAHDRFRKAIFGEHPYGNSLGQADTLETILNKDLDDFRNQHYIPNNASLIVVGAVSSEDLLELAREKLGPWTKGCLQEASYPEFPRLEKLSIQLVRGGEASSEARIFFGHTTPHRLSSDFYNLKVLNLILGGLSTGSRLSSAFLSRQINYRLLDSRIRFYRIGGMLEVLAKVPSEAAPAALTAIVQAVESLKQSPVSESELESAKSQLLASHGEALRSPDAIADQLIQMELFSLSKDFLDRFADRVRGLTSGDVQGAAKAHLSTTRAVAVVTGVNPEVHSEWVKLGTTVEVDVPRRLD